MILNHVNNGGALPKNLRPDDIDFFMEQNDDIKFPELIVGLNQSSEETLP